MASHRTRIARLMRAAEIAGVSRRRSAPITTRQATHHHPASHLVRRNFMAERPNALWVAEITVPQQAAREMGAGLPRSACRSGSQTTVSGVGQKPGSWVLRRRRFKKRRQVGDRKASHPDRPAGPSPVSRAWRLPHCAHTWPRVSPPCSWARSNGVAWGHHGREHRPLFAYSS
jgi:hypothetical protein